MAQLGGLHGRPDADPANLHPLGCQPLPCHQRHLLLLPVPLILSPCSSQSDRGRVQAEPGGRSVLLLRDGRGRRLSDGEGPLPGLVLPAAPPLPGPERLQHLPRQLLLPEPRRRLLHRLLLHHGQFCLPCLPCASQADPRIPCSRVPWRLLLRDDPEDEPVWDNGH